MQLAVQKQKNASQATKYVAKTAMRQCKLSIGI